MVEAVEFGFLRSFLLSGYFSVCPFLLPTWQNLCWLACLFLCLAIVAPCFKHSSLFFFFFTFPVVDLFAFFWICYLKFELITGRFLILQVVCAAAMNSGAQLASTVKNAKYLFIFFWTIPNNQTLSWWPGLEKKTQERCPAGNESSPSLCHVNLWVPASSCLVSRQRRYCVSPLGRPAL